MIDLPNAEPKQQRRLNQIIAKWVKIDFETFEDDVPGLIGCRFPPWVVLQHPDQCERALREIQLMATDEYVHFLSPLHEFAIYHCAKEWLEHNRVSLAEEKDPKEAARLKRVIAELDLLLDMAFDDTDFLMVPEMVKALEQGGGLTQEFGVDVAAYVDLMPDDVRSRVEQQLKAAEEGRREDAASPPDTPPP